MQQQDPFIIVLNHQKYHFECYITNGVQTLPILYSGIDGLYLEEDILNWWIRGHITVANSFEVFERDYEVVGSKGYVFRNDGFDLLYFNIYPVFDDLDMPDLNKEIWHLKGTYSIYDTQELVSSASSKSKRLYFWDYEYQLMISKNISWSTANLFKRDNSTSYAQKRDSEKEFATGLCIKDIITTTLPTPEQIFASDWNTGVSKIFYTSGATEKAIDTLNYVLNLHVAESTSSNSYDFCILDRKRYSKEWELRSLSDYFKYATNNITKPGVLQRERFVIDGLQTGKQKSLKSTSKVPKLDAGTISLDMDVSFNEFSKISFYKFVDMSGIDNINGITNRPVYSNNLTKKQFNVSSFANSVNSCITTYTNSYISKVYRDVNTNPSQNLLFNNDNRVRNEFYDVVPVYSYSSDTIKQFAIGRNVTLKSLLFLNQAISFQCKGLLCRSPGVFIGIEREDGNSNSDYDNKVLGQWFVANVKHIFIGQSYSNDMTALKIHSHSKSLLK